jgi:exonuclease VII small subunit
MNALAEVSCMERSYEMSRNEFESIIDFLESGDVTAMSQSDLERAIQEKSFELMRQLLQEHIHNRGPGICGEPVVGADGVKRSRLQYHERQIETIFGTITTNRAGYGQEGCESLHPLDAELNLPKERYSLELRRRVAEEAARISFDETLEMIGKTTAGHVPKRQAEELIIRAACDFNDFYRGRHQSAVAAPDTGSVLAMSVDGKGIVMRPEDLREQTRKAAENRTHKMEKRLSPGEKKNAKRMATVAAVYTTPPFVRLPEDFMSGDFSSQRPSLEHKRVWASIEKTPEQVIAEMFEEAGSRDPGYEKTWVALVDGNKTQIRILRRMAKKTKPDLTIVVDIIHVIEYLWDAGRVFYPQRGQYLEDWVNHRLGEILKGKAGCVAGGMRRSATKRRLEPEIRKPVDKCARYLTNHLPYLRYDRYLAQGLPIATGVIEGACRHLVKDRMEITGARWSLTGAEAILSLRALRSSQNFEEYWLFHEAREYERNHQSRYAKNNVPHTIKPPAPRTSNRRAHLRRIK